MTRLEGHEDVQRRCEVLGQLNEYIDGELVPDLCREVERHLADCPDCQVVFDTLNKTILLYRELGNATTELPPEIEVRLLRRLDAGMGARGSAEGEALS